VVEAQWRGADSCGFSFLPSSFCHIMACIFATYGRKISTTLSVIQLHFLLFWGMVTGSLTSLPMNSGHCPVRTSSLYFHQQMSSVTKSISDLSSSISSAFPFPSASFPSLSSSSSPRPAHHSSSTSTSLKKKSSLKQQLKHDSFLNRLSLDNPPVVVSSSDSSSVGQNSNCHQTSSSKNKNKKRQQLMEELISPRSSSSCSSSSSSTFSSPFSPSGAYEIIVIGLSHHTASVDIREKLSITESEWNHASTELVTQHDSIEEAAVLSTCNRFEMYIVGRNQYEAMTDALNYLLKRTNGTVEEEVLRQSIFMLSGQDAIWHLMRVTAGEQPSLFVCLTLTSLSLCVGLDSIVVGEGQILSQVKQAYTKSIQEDGKAGPILSTMMKSCISAGQRVRSETNICKGAISVSSAAVEFMTMKLKQEKETIPLESLNHVIIGAGKMARLLLIHLQSHGVKKVSIVNRSPESVHALQVPPSFLHPLSHHFLLQAELPALQLTYFPMSDMTSAISTGDIIYPCTASVSPIITPSHITDILHHRQQLHQDQDQNHEHHSRIPPLRFIDISVPRNVHPDCAITSSGHTTTTPPPPQPLIECFNVDDLKELVETNLFKRKREVLDAERILRDEILKYELWKENLGGTLPTIEKLQNKAEELRLQEFSKVLEKLNTLTHEELGVVNSLSKGIVSTLIRGPLLHLRKQKALDSTKLAITQLQAAFQLE
jgi:glutamyl-tRNA reductase